MADLWYNDAMQLRDFANALESAEYVDADVVLRKPYKFDAEFEAWKSNRCPNPEDGEWDEFITALNALADE